MEPTNLLDLAEMQSQLGQRLHSLALRSPASCQQECQSLLAGDGSDGGPGPGVVAYALTFSGLADIKLGHLERALQTLRRAQHEARAESLPGLVALADNGIGCCLHRMGDYENSLLTFGALTQCQLYKSSEVLQALVLHNIGGLFASLDDHDTAVQWYERAAALRVSREDRRFFLFCQSNIGASLGALGRHAEALSLLLRTCDSFVEGEDASYVAQTRCDLASQYLALRRNDKAQREAEVALSMARAHALLRVEATACLVLAQLSAEAGMQAACAGYISSALEAAGPTGALPLQRSVCVAMATNCERNRDAAGALQHQLAAQRIELQLLRRLAQGRARALAPMPSVEMGKRPAPVSAVGHSADQRRPIAANAHAQLTSAGLTKREIEVLEFMELGLSNREIAGRMGLSYFTIRHHVSSVLGKLHVESRTEAVARAVRCRLPQIALTH